MNSKVLVIFTIIFFLVSALFLAYTESRQSDENFQKDWWVLSFNDPKNGDLNFTIENHSQKSSFHWELISGTDTISEGDVKIAKGSTWTSNVQVDNLSGKTSIRVSSGSDKKEIYKSL
ncbi:MAG: hypothetical protein WC608_01410 [Parcubacteria group bacterium]